MVYIHSVYLPVHKCSRLYFSCRSVHCVSSVALLQSATCNGKLQVQSSVQSLPAPGTTYGGNVSRGNAKSCRLEISALQHWNGYSDSDLFGHASTFILAWNLLVSWCLSEMKIKITIMYNFKKLIVKVNFVRILKTNKNWSQSCTRVVWTPLFWFNYREQTSEQIHVLIHLSFV